MPRSVSGDVGSNDRSQSGRVGMPVETQTWQYSLISTRLQEYGYVGYAPQWQALSVLGLVASQNPNVWLGERWGVAANFAGMQP